MKNRLSCVLCYLLATACINRTIKTKWQIVFTLRTEFGHFPIRDWDGFYKQTNKWQILNKHDQCLGRQVLVNNNTGYYPAILMIRVVHETTFRSNNCYNCYTMYH